MSRLALELAACADSRKAAREGAWVHGHVTAAPGLMKGLVTVASVEVNALRVVPAPPVRPEF